MQSSSPQTACMPGRKPRVDCSSSEDYWERQPPCRLVLRQSPELQATRGQNRDSRCNLRLSPEAAAELVTPAVEQEEHLADQTVHAVGGEGVILDRGMRPCGAQALQVPEVEGLLAIRGLLSEEEAARLLSVAEAAGFDVALGLPTAVLLARRPLCSALFSRLYPALQETYPGALGLNARWRVYRYTEGDTFEPHIDGSWPCSGLASELSGHNNDGEQAIIVRSYSSAPNLTNLLGYCLFDAAYPRFSFIFAFHTFGLECPLSQNFMSDVRSIKLKPICAL